MFIIFGILLFSLSHVDLVCANLSDINDFNVIIVGEDPTFLGNYSEEALVYRELPNGSQENLSILGPPQIIKINKIRYNKDKLNISYVFDNTNIIGNAVSVEIWVTDDQDAEIVRAFDVFPITKDGLIERNVLIDAPDDLDGNYYIYFALSGYLEDSIGQLIVIVGENGKPENKSGADDKSGDDSGLEKVSDLIAENRTSFLTGKTVTFLRNPEIRNVGYSVIVLIIMIGAFLMMRSSWKKAFKDSSSEPLEPAKPVKSSQPSQAATGYPLPNIPFKKHAKIIKSIPKNIVKKVVTRVHKKPSKTRTGKKRKRNLPNLDLVSRK